MFISHINNTFTFNEKTWLISILNYENEKNDHNIARAAIIIEGVIYHRLLFGRYDIYAKPWGKSKKNPCAYVSQIECFEAYHYEGDFKNSKSMSYHATPKECENLSQNIRRIATIANNNNSITAETLINPILIEHSCINWCLDLLWNHGLLFRTMTV